MTINLEGEVNQGMFEKLIKAFNESKDNLNIYFSSPEGGGTDTSEAIIDFINKNAENIDMTFYGENFSSGMTIFLKTLCKKQVLPDTRGMYHFCWQEMSISEGGKPSGEYDKFSLKGMKESKERTIDFLKTTKLTEKEISSIKKGKDVYFSFDRMKEIIS